MAVNFAHEYKKFEEQQARLRKEYMAAGMSDEQICIMYKFDKAQLARDLAYKRRTQSLFTESDDFESETQSALLDKFMDVLSYTMEPDTSKPLWWLEEISDPSFLKAVKKLSSEQIELLDMYVFDSLSQTDIARRLGVNQSSVSRQLNKIKEILIDFDFHA